MNVNPKAFLAKLAPFPLTAALVVPALETTYMPFPPIKGREGVQTTSTFGLCCQVIQSANPDFAIHLLSDFGQTA